MPDDFWEHEALRSALASRHMGKAIHAYRHHSFHGRRAVSQETVAAWLSITQPQLSRIETGAPIAHLDRLVHCATTLGIPQSYLWFALPETPWESGLSPTPGWATANRSPNDAVTNSPNGPNGVNGSDGTACNGTAADPFRRDQATDPTQSRGRPANESDSDVRRRDLLKLGGLVISGRVLDLLNFEPDRLRTALTTPSVGEDRLIYYETVADQLGKDVVAVPPTELLEEATSAFCDVRALIEEHQRPRQQTRLMLVAAKLATVVGEILFNVGDMTVAQQWYLTAIDASGEIGHQYFSDIALAGMAYLPMYSDNPQGVVDMVSGRLEQSPAPTPAVAWLWGATARAQAMLGDKPGFERSIASCREALAGSSDDLIHPGIMSFLPAKLEFYEAEGYSRFGDLDRCAAAATRSLELYDENETMDPALVRLDYAMALAGAGEIGEGCRVATEAITDPKTFVGHSICKWSDNFDEVLNGSKLPAVRDWRENYHVVSSGATAVADPSPVICDVPEPGLV